MRRVLWHHWAVLLIAAIYTAAMASDSNWQWWLACACSIWFLMQWWTWVARREIRQRIEQRERDYRRRLAAEMAARRRLGMAAGHPEHLAKSLGSEREEWLERLEADLWPDGYAVKRDGGQP